MAEENNHAARWVDIDEVVPWESNPRDNDVAVAAVVKSIKRFGFASPIIARQSDKVVIAGHTRLKAAKILGLDKVPVRYMKLDPAEARALALADNKLGERATWDEESLRNILAELDKQDTELSDLGWSARQLSQLLDMESSHGEEDQILFERLEVLVICENEKEQRRAIELIEGGGFECSALIS